MPEIIIEEIRPEKGHLVGLYSHGELICAIVRELAAEKKLRPGEYTEEALRALLTESQRRRAKAKALYLLNYRDYSSRDLRDRLRKEFDQDATEQALTFMKEIGALDDARYAENMIRHLIFRKHYGSRRILRELTGKGIDGTTAAQALSRFELDEPAAIAALLRDQFSHDLGDDKGIRRTVATLQRYGYASGDIWDALRNAPEDSGDEALSESYTDY